MVVVKIELWPHGDESKSRQIGLAYITNDGSGDVGVGNYKVELKHGGRFYGKPGNWRAGGLTGFQRSLSPYHLVSLAFGSVLFMD